jgi:hypothetical protein
MFHLDYLSCGLTVLATVLLARKSWIGLLIAIVNSLIVCAIALRTSQLGLIPANLICICIYASKTRSWLYEQTRTNRDQAPRQDTVADGLRTKPGGEHRAATSTAVREVPVGRLSTVGAIVSRTSTRPGSMNTLRRFVREEGRVHGLDRMYSTQRTFSRQHHHACVAKENQLRCWWPQKTEPLTLIPTTELEPDRACLPGLGRNGD